MKKLIVLSCLTLFASAAAAQEEVPDLRKMRVEGPLKESLAPIGESTRSAVDWHPDLEAAKAAAAKSKKPILLFQLLGKLDEEFC